jgi:hypothetical protein
MAHWKCFVLWALILLIGDLWSCGRSQQGLESRGFSESAPIVIEVEEDLGTTVFGERADLNFGGKVVNVQRAHFLNEDAVREVLRDALCNYVIICTDGSCDCIKNLNFDIARWGYRRCWEEFGDLVSSGEIWYVASNTYKIYVDGSEGPYYVEIVDIGTKLTQKEVEVGITVLPLVNYE